MPFSHDRSIYFRETDAAGVVYFAHVLSFCHEAYEASLSAVGIDVGHFFGADVLAFPIVHSQVDFFKPLRCGNIVTIVVTPEIVSAHQFISRYQLYWGGTDTLVAQASITHTCIDRASRQKQPLPDFLRQWIQAWG